MRKTNKLVIIVSVVGFAFFGLTMRSSGRNQNANSSTPPQSQQSPSPQPDFSKNTWELPADADKTKNPTAATPESVSKGKELYLERTKGNCIFCHGETGSGNEANLPRLRRKPADLSNKERMTAMTDGEIFWKLSKGITGIMPAGEKRMTEEERWHVVNYVRTLAKEPVSH
ncbi:MAG TPA: cytochrome c [Pyrinomonadaceae bacterium]|jgi:mono/diheme cytochrome c family protein